jgi:hypothetical protein
MACGLSAIVTGYGAATDFCDERTSRDRFSTSFPHSRVPPAILPVARRSNTREPYAWSTDSKPLVIEQPGDMLLDLPSRLGIGSAVGTDGIGDVVAIGMEHSSALGEVRGKIEDNVDVLGGEADHKVGLAEQVRGCASAGVGS